MMVSLGIDLVLSGCVFYLACFIFEVRVLFCRVLIFFPVLFLLLWLPDGVGSGAAFLCGYSDRPVAKGLLVQASLELWLCWTPNWTQYCILNPELLLIGRLTSCPEASTIGVCEWESDATMLSTLGTAKVEKCYISLDHFLMIFW